MSKITCEICGTVYADNATACPICGYPRQDSETAVADEAAAAGTAAAAAVSRERVKGGRFSNKNVKKRNKAAAKAEDSRYIPAEQSASIPDDEDDEPRQKNPNKALLVIVAILAIAVVLVGAYIAFRFFAGSDAYGGKETTASTTDAASTGETTAATTLPAETGVPCVGLTVSDTPVEFNAPDRAWLLGVTVQPENTTEALIFESSDENVVTVSADGRVTSVGAGEAVITITCGQVTKTIRVVCDFPEETTAPSETTEPVETTEPTEVTTEATEPEGDDDDNSGLTLTYTDVTLGYDGESFTIRVKYDGTSIDRANVTWSSSNTEIATVDNGVVTGVGPGTATISATYNGKTEKCIVRCNFKDEEETEPTEETTEPEATESEWSISHTDVTIKVGESFSLKIKNSDGTTASVTWSASKSGIVSVEGNTVTGLTSGTTTLSATVEGVTYQCIVRVG